MADASTAPPQQADAPKAKKPKTVITPEDQQLDDAVLALLNEQVRSSFQFNSFFFSPRDVAQTSAIAGDRIADLLQKDKVTLVQSYNRLVKRVSRVEI